MAVSVGVGGGTVSVGVAVAVSTGSRAVAVGVSVGVSVGVGASVGNSATWAGVGVAKGELSTTIGRLMIFEVGVSRGNSPSLTAIVASGVGT